MAAGTVTRPGGRTATGPAARRLSAREAEVVALITSGLGNREIAEHTLLSINSVKTYIRAAYQKMGVDSRSRAVLWGVEHGMSAKPRRVILDSEI